MIELAARSNDLPLEFFARVIWQESRFQSDAVGPVTRNGQRAEGIAQFMPGTASERRLLDPFDPVQALPKSAEFLSELRNQFGNLGLAAAAYNAGPRRVQEWLAGTGPMPQETRNYVSAITGTTVDDWAAAGKNGKMADRAPNTSCRELMALLRRAPNSFVTELEQHVKLAAAKLWGVQLAAGFDRNKALAMYARAMKRLSAVIGDQDPSLLSYADAHAGHPHLLPGADRRRHAARGGRSLQPHPPRRRRLFRAAKHGRQGAESGPVCMTALRRRRSLDVGPFSPALCAARYSNIVRLPLALPALDSPTSWQNPVRAFAWGMCVGHLDGADPGAVCDLSRHRRARA